MALLLIANQNFRVLKNPSLKYLQQPTLAWFYFRMQGVMNFSLHHEIRILEVLYNNCNLCAKSDLQWLPVSWTNSKLQKTCIPDNFRWKVAKNSWHPGNVHQTIASFFRCIRFVNRLFRVVLKLTRSNSKIPKNIEWCFAMIGNFSRFMFVATISGVSLFKSLS